MHTLSQTNILQALGWAVLNSLWQLALLWMVYQIITSVYRGAKPFFRSSLATSLLITGFAWFLYTLINGIADQRASGTLAALPGDTVAGAKLNNWLRQTLPVASITYLVLLILPVLHFIRNYRYVRIIRQDGLTKADVQWRIFVNKVAAQMGIKKKVQVWISAFVSSPVTVGFLKPIILFPVAAVNGLSQQQLEAVLLHELSHIRRADYLINLIINIIRTILYFNPFVNAFVKTVEREREKSCDEMVMQFQYDPHGYASALIILEKAHRQPEIFTIAAAGKKNDLLNRVEHILGVQKKPVFSFNRIAGIFAALLAVVALNALVIINKPGNTKTAGAFPGLSSPFSFFTGGIKEGVSPVVVKETKPESGTTSTALATVTENKPASISNHLARPASGEIHLSSLLPLAREALIATPAFMNANFSSAEIPVLKSYEEAQVKEAVQASRKVLENIEWKAVENKVAEVLTQQQKIQLKSNLQKALQKIDWNNLEDKLRIAYDNIDWETINEQLNKAVVNIRLDSLQASFNMAASELDQLTAELHANELSGIPDTDITLKDVEQKKVEIQKSLRTLRSVRSKKIVHL